MLAVEKAIAAKIAADIVILPSRAPTIVPGGGDLPPRADTGILTRL